MKTKFLSLIMAGGSGLRLWPVSTMDRPKQFLPLITNRPMLLETLERFESVIPLEYQYVITGESQKHDAQDVLKGILNPENLLVEPAPKNTAPGILLGLFQMLMKGHAGDTILVIAPSDHVIINQKKFHHALKRAFEFLHHHESILMMGIAPTFPHTGYGYIQSGLETEFKEVYQVEGFTEKPQVAKAREYLAQGNFFWNAGIFIGRLDLFLKEFETHAPALYKAFEKAFQTPKPDLKELYQGLTSISVDYAVWEKSEKLHLIRGDFDWNDLGTWISMELSLPQNQGNFSKVKHLVSENAEGNIIFAPGQKVILSGLKDYLVVSTPDELVIVPKEKSGDLHSYVKARDTGPKSV